MLLVLSSFVRQILFSAVVTLSKHYWVSFGERRRALVQEALGCSQTEAWRILRKLGAEPGPGGALVLAREVFLERVRAYLEDPRVRFELRRRERLETALDALNPRTRARLVKVVGEDRPAAAVELLGSRFDQLPAGVELTPHSLHIEFRGREEFLERLGAVIFAA